MNVLDLGAFSTTPVRASQMSRTKTEPAIATFVDNRSIKRLVEVKNKVLTRPFRVVKLGLYLVRSDKLKSN